MPSGLAGVFGRNRQNESRGQTICLQGFVSRYRGVAQIEVALYDGKSRLLSF